MKLAIIGFGVVGSGVAELFYKNQSSIERKCGQKLELAYIMNRKGLQGTPYADKQAESFEQILNDKDVGLVIEVIGGIEPAYTYSKKSLMAGKHVVTSNKELVATHGAELLQIAKQNNVNYLFEASVGGGIPIIHPLYQCLGAGETTEIAGILNGTTNIIMTRMIADGMSFEEALALAQKNGYAEADPSADIMGHDACRKIAILASIAFGKHVYPDEIYTEGITEISRNDVTSASQAGYAVKLIGRAAKRGKKLDAMVSPALIPKSSQLANVSDVFNGILVRSEDTGDVVFYGRGAGKLPTASAVIADVVDALKEGGHIDTLGWEDSNHDTVEDYRLDKTRVMVRYRDGKSPKSLDGLVPVARINDEIAVITGEITGEELLRIRACEGVISAIRMLEY